MKKKKNADKRLRVLLYLVLILAMALLLVFIAARAMGDVSFSRAQDGFRDFFSGLTEGKGYPYEIDLRNIRQIDTISSGLLLLSGDSSLSLSGSAGTLMTKKLAFTNPAFSAAYGRAVVYDRNSGEWLLQSATKVLMEKKMKMNVLTASVGRKGNVAVVTASESAQSLLTVFDKERQTVFEWKCAKERISAVALSDDGKSVAVAAVGAQDAQLYTRLLVFEFNKKDPVSDIRYGGTALFRLRFSGTGKLLAFGDNLMSAVAVKTEQREELPYPAGSSLYRLSIADNGRSALVLSEHGDKTATKLYVFDKNGQKEWEQAQGGILDVACSNSYTAVLREDGISVYSNKGEERNTFPLEEHISQIFINGRRVYAVGWRAIAQYSF